MRIDDDIEYACTDHEPPSRAQAALGQLRAVAALNAEFEAARRDGGDTLAIQGRLNTALRNCEVLGAL